MKTSELAAMKRVAVYRADLLPISETFIRDQVSALSNWEPVLVGRRETPGGLLTPGIRREIVPDDGNRLTRALRLGLWMADPQMVMRLRSLQLDLVHAHFGVDATDVWPSVKAAGLPMIVTLHGYDINIHRAWWEAGHGGVHRRLYPRRLLKMARDPRVRFIAVSNAIRAQAIEYGISAEKIAVAYVGVDTQHFQPGEVALESRRNRILFVGRMVEKKAPLLMVRAFAELRNNVPDAELIMIGDGALLPAARQLANELQLSVKFLGSQPSEVVLAHLHDAKVLCLPSITAANGDAEGFGMVILEAQACGVPVITSARGGAREGVLHGRSGFAFGEGAIAELVAGARALLCDGTFSSTASLAAASFVRERFNIRKCSDALESIYHESIRI